jgi:hypothetical protein
MDSTFKAEVSSENTENYIKFLSVRFDCLATQKQKDMRKTSLCFKTGKKNFYLGRTASKSFKELISCMLNSSLRSTKFFYWCKEKKYINILEDNLPLSKLQFIRLIKG